MLRLEGRTSLWEMSKAVRSGLLLVLPALATLLSASCSGDAFHIDDVATAGEASGGEGAGGGMSFGGVSSDAGSDSGGATDAAGASGTAGAPGACDGPEACAVGEFCRDGTCTSCLDLSDLSSLAYGPAVPFDVINDSTNQEGLRFARRLPDGVGLVYVRDFFGGALWFTGAPDDSAGAALSKTDVFETGGLPVANQLPAPLADFDFFFSRRARVGTEPVPTRLFGAKRKADGTLGGEQDLPAPFNSDSVVSSHALALSAKRAVWTRNVDGMLHIQLVTSPLPPEGEATELRLPLPDGCGFAGEFDFAQWLTPDGTTLFFAARRVDEGCTPAAGAVTHIYAVGLSSAGQPIGTARALSGLAEPAVRQSDPSLSPDGCELLFSAQPGASMQLFRAPRRR